MTFKPPPVFTPPPASEPVWIGIDPAQGPDQSATYTLGQYEESGLYQLARTIANEALDAKTTAEINTIAINRAADLAALSQHARPLALTLSECFKDRRALLAARGK